VSFEYCLYRDDDPVTPADPRWQWSLPLYRRERLGSVKSSTTGHRPTVGDYFYAVAAFLDGPARKPLFEAQAVRQSTRDDFETHPMRITLEKHGALYHPARVAIITPTGQATVVVNVALSTEGADVLAREYDTLADLNAKTARAFLPAVCAMADHKAARWPMFMAQWFTGYHEFHLSRRPDRSLSIKLWQPSGSSFLSEAQTIELYRQAAYLLTRLYDPFSTRQIFPWHMAAGDFVVAATPEALDLRLITARDYRPLIPRGRDESAQAMLEGLINFFLHLSLRLRLDRLDGTGPRAWAPASALEGIVVGFLEALQRLAELDPRLDDLPLATAYALSRLSPAKLDSQLAAIGSRWFAANAEKAFVASRLVAHTGELHTAIAPFFIDKTD
jgi:hypothetical protein